MGTESETDAERNVSSSTGSDDELTQERHLCHNFYTFYHLYYPV